MNSYPFWGKKSGLVPFVQDEMRDKYGRGDHYHTLSQTGGQAFPGAFFYLNIIFGPLIWLWNRTRKGECDDSSWCYGSAWVGDILERTGGRIEIDGMNEISKIDGPCVFVANHMSTLETFLLPGIIRVRKPVTFVVKQSLVHMPVFGPIMRSRNPIVVTRENPREDLAKVLREGLDNLQRGISVVVFPQSTRSINFSPRQFNSIGIKLAAKANVPVIPLALKTDVWGQGRHIKELGKICPRMPARFRFGEPVTISGNGRREHGEICDFIGRTVAQWQVKDGINQ